MIYKLLEESLHRKVWKLTKIEFPNRLHWIRHCALCHQDFTTLLVQTVNTINFNVDIHKHIQCHYVQNHLFIMSMIVPMKGHKSWPGRRIIKMRVDGSRPFNFCGNIFRSGIKKWRYTKSTSATTLPCCIPT